MVRFMCHIYSGCPTPSWHRPQRRERRPRLQQQQPQYPADQQPVLQRQYQQRPLRWSLCRSLALDVSTQGGNVQYKSWYEIIRRNWGASGQWWERGEISGQQEEEQERDSLQILSSSAAVAGEEEIGLRLTGGENCRAEGRFYLPTFLSFLLPYINCLRSHRCCWEEEQGRANMF